MRDEGEKEERSLKLSLSAIESLLNSKSLK